MVSCLTAGTVANFTSISFSGSLVVSNYMGQLTGSASSSQDDGTYVGVFAFCSSSTLNVTGAVISPTNMTGLKKIGAFGAVSASTAQYWNVQINGGSYYTRDWASIFSPVIISSVGFVQNMTLSGTVTGVSDGATGCRDRSGAVAAQVWDSNFQFLNVSASPTIQAWSSIGIFG